jgi:hypothetical protein
MNSKQRLVYGIVDDNLILLPEDTANAFAANYQATLSLKTYGEARRFLPQSLNGVPGLDEDVHDDIPADEDPYNAVRTNEYENGDWPPPAATIALDELPDDPDDIGEQVEHFPNFAALYIDPASEADLVRVLTQRGHEVRRDDELIGRV